MNKVICQRPFNLIFNRTSKNYSPCCWAHDVLNLSPKDLTPFEYFNGEELTRIRKEMLAGEKTEFLNDYCKRCWRWEETLGYSPRTENIPTKELIFNFDSEGQYLKSNHRFLEIEINIYGNYCNLECYMCHSELSSSRNAALKKLPVEWRTYSGTAITDFEILNNKYDPDIQKIDKLQFDKIIDELVEYSKNIITIRILGGEPVLMKSHFILLDKLIECGEAKNIELQYVSNMTLINVNELNDKYFKKFKHIDIQWSMEGLEKRNEWLRYPTNWKNTVNNVKQFQKIVKNGTIRATMTPSILSVYTLKETCHWLYLNHLIDNKFRFNNILETPYMLHPRHLPNEIKEEIIPKLSKLNQKFCNLIALERDEEEFQHALRYFDDLDQSRGTDWKSTFPELAHYSK